MTETAVRKIVVSSHAMVRARERFSPDMRTPDIRCDVREALDAGREGVRPPVRLALSRSARRHDLRFVWTEDLGRFYLVKRRRERVSGAPILVVVTVLVAEGQRP